MVSWEREQQPEKQQLFARLTYVFLVKIQSPRDKREQAAAKSGVPGWGVLLNGTATRLKSLMHKSHSVNFFTWLNIKKKKKET